MIQKVKITIVIMITNINYRGKLVPGEVEKLTYLNGPPPCQRVLKTAFGTLVIFKTGNFRLMGAKTPIEDFSVLPLRAEYLRLQSMSASADLGEQVNLQLLANRLKSTQCQYEPEIFPAARLMQFNPLCVNIFASGKVIITGLRDAQKLNDLISEIRALVFQ